MPDSYSVLSFALTGALIAFLRFNLFSTRNKIFLGDTGSLVMGITISIIAVKFLQANLLTTGHIHIHSAPAVVFGILIYPLFDTLRVFSLRVMQGKSPFSADRQHIHHRFIGAGYSHIMTSAIILYFNVVLIIVSFTLQDLNNLILIMIHPEILI